MFVLWHEHVFIQCSPNLLTSVFSTVCIFLCGHFCFCPICHHKHISSLFCSLNNLYHTRNDVVSPWLQLWCYSICTEKYNRRPVRWCAWVCTLPAEVNAALYLQHTLLYSPVCCDHLHLTAYKFLEAMFEVLDRRPCQQGQHALTHSGVDPLHPLVAASISKFIISVTCGTHNSHVNQSNRQKQTEFFVYIIQQGSCRVGGLWDQTPTSNI